MRNVKVLAVVLMMLMGSGCAEQYEWSKTVQLPGALPKEQQKIIANCAISKIHPDELRTTLLGRFPTAHRGWIEGIRIGARDTSKIKDYNGSDVDILIQMPSSKELFQAPNPVMDFLESKVKEEIGNCS